jgi:ABC-type Fe3+ transport system permease subunit
MALFTQQLEKKIIIIINIKTTIRIIVLIIIIIIIIIIINDWEQQAREKQLEEARRLADLQKKRELKGGFLRFLICPFILIFYLLTFFCSCWY